MDLLGWDSCDVIVVTGDAYVDHPSFGMAIVGRVLEAQGFRVGIIAQPDWHSADAFAALGRPNLFFGITAGNMIPWSIATRRIAGSAAMMHTRREARAASGLTAPSSFMRSVLVRRSRTFRSLLVASKPLCDESRILTIGREKVRRSVLLDSKADLLVYGNGERQICEIAHRLAAGESVSDITDLRGTAFVRKSRPEGWIEIDSTHLDAPGPLNPPLDPYAMEPTSSGGCRCRRWSRRICW